MNQYTVQKGDTITQVTKRLRTNWQTLRNQNPQAIGRSKANGNWFVREGANVAVDNGGKANFSAALNRAAKQMVSTPEPPASRQAAEVVEYTVQPGDTLWGLAVRQFHVNLQDLVDDNGITNPDVLEVGQKLEIRKTGPEPPAEVVASWYGQDYHGRPMANGDRYDMFADTIAHKELPFGTRVELKNPRTGEKTTAVVTDRGPFIEGRDVDLSYGLACRLSLVENGVDTLVMRIL
jgi:rare lipoprotein A